MIVIEITEEHELTPQERALVRRLENALSIAMPPYRAPKWTHICQAHPSGVVVLIAEPLCIGERTLRVVVAMDAGDAAEESPRVSFLNNETKLVGAAGSAFFPQVKPKEA